MLETKMKNCPSFKQKAEKQPGPAVQGQLPVEETAWPGAESSDLMCLRSKAAAKKTFHDRHQKCRDYTRDFRTLPDSY